jgi:hypothetical protein
MDDGAAIQTEHSRAIQTVEASPHRRESLCENAFHMRQIAEVLITVQPGKNLRWLSTLGDAF